MLMPSSFPRRILFLSLALTAGVALFSGCTGRTVVEGTDAGTNDGNDGPIACESADECPDPANYDCVGGSCLQRCAADGVCRPDEFCSARSYCERGCRDSSTCEDGKVCSTGSCISSGGLGSCATKCDCDPGKVCAGGVCQDPPSVCNGPADCGRGAGDQCEDYLCNGFTKQCFDDDPDPCAQNADCAGRPGCQDGCLCSPNSQCVPAAGCTAHDDCGAGFYCTADLQCDVAPACTTQVSCPSDLVCNQGTGTCEAPRPCAVDTECTVAPATHCDTGTGACVIPTCDNGGTTCQATQDCVNGNCVAAGTGQACDSDADCPNELWPNTQFCNFQTISGDGECSVGCRSNASCTGQQQCNASRQCVDPGTNPGGDPGLGQVGDACDEPGFDPDCQFGTICKLDTGTCEETCEAVGPCTGGSCCALSGYGNCSQGVFFNWCTP